VLGEDGWYSDYRPVPEHLKPVAPTASPVIPKVDIDGSLLALVSNWRIVVAELNARGIDIYDPAVRARPWPGVRTAIFDLIDTPGSRLRAALTRR
jgi:hypothetical protein